MTGKYLVFFIYHFLILLSFVLRRNSPEYEADYLELVKDLQTIELPKKESIIIYGPNAFPVVTKNEAYAYVAAGHYGAVILRK